MRDLVLLSKLIWLPNPYNGCKIYVDIMTGEICCQFSQLDIDINYYHLMIFSLFLNKKSGKVFLSNDSAKETVQLFINVSSSCSLYKYSISLSLSLPLQQSNYSIIRNCLSVCFFCPSICPIIIEDFSSIRFLQLCSIYNF